MNKVLKKDCDIKIKKFFHKNEMEPLPFQIESWNSFLNGENGIIQVPTGCGKTYAALMGPLFKWIQQKDINGLNILLITPLKALSRDIKKAIIRASNYFDESITVGIRNGDTSPYEKKKQLTKPPNILITTPESLSLLISNKNSISFFANIYSIIVDEWHELMGSKRGNQVELLISWIRGNNKNIQIWGMSATLGNIKDAGRALVGVNAQTPKIITSNLSKEIEIESVIPNNIGTFPWSGHLGLKSHKSLLSKIDKNKSTLFFTNTRNQSEKWFQCLKFYNEDIEDKIAIHHGSLDKKERKSVEDGVKSGEIKWVVCTSSLDLGIDFQPVEQIVQIGSAKNLARLIQRAGRSSHKPGGKSKIIFMPTNALELLEVSAMRRIIKKGISEKIELPELSYDVLLQHLITLGCGPGFDPKVEKDRIKNCWSYRNLKEEDWNWCIDFLEFGGKCLNAYPKYKKLYKQIISSRNNTFRYIIKDQSIIRIHKYNIGTITSDKYVLVKYIKGRSLGNLEENFAAKLKSGDTFLFSGRILEFLKLENMTLFVRRSSKKTSIVPAWLGGQIAISDLLSENLRKEISISLLDEKTNIELSSLRPVLQKQYKLSYIPKENELLIEIFKSKSFQSLFVYTLEGKLVNEGIAFLWALRFTKISKCTFTISSNDFGFCLTTHKDFDFSILNKVINKFLDIKNLDQDLENAINFSELTKKKFKNIAQISGLVNNNNPNKLKSSNQLQISSNLLFDVFKKYEINHLLIKQAHNEVNNYQLEKTRIKKCLKRMSNLKILIKEIKIPTPFAFPLLVERLNNTLSNESIEKRVDKLIKSYEE